MTDTTSLIKFKAISNFVKELNEVFSKEHRPLKLYEHLLKNTTLEHEKIINKHIEAFKKFCVDNRDAIMNNDIKKITTSKIVYSNRVFINIHEIFKLADKETQNIIWKHLLTISALVDTMSKAKQILREQSENDTNKTQEVDFLTNIISKVEENVDSKSNPMEAISSIMQSGVFTELIEGMGDGLQNGSLDINKLMGSLQGMLGKISQDDSGEGGDTAQFMNMFQSMMSNMNNQSQQNTSDSEQQIQPDINSLLGPMMSMMNNQSQQNTSGSEQQLQPDINSLLGPMMSMMNNGGGSSGDMKQFLPDTQKQ